MDFEKVNSKSGHILSAGYENGRMVVNFTSGSYEYNGIPQDEWDSFRSTFPSEDTSTGSHFHKHIRKYQGKKL